MDTENLIERYTSEKKHIEKEKEKSVSKIDKKRIKEIKALKRRLEKEEDKINKEYDRKVQHQENFCDAEKKKAEKRFTRRAAGGMINNLEKDYAVLLGRSKMFEMSEEDIEKARKVRDIIQSINGDELNTKKVDNVVKALELDSDITNIVLSLSDHENIKENKIVSYVSADKERCYLISPVVAPVDGELLVQRLDEKVTRILELGRIIPGSAGSLDKSGTVESLDVHAFRFKARKGDIHGFSMYTIEPTDYMDSDNISILKCAFADKLNELQPEKFKDMSLVHKVISVEYPVVAYALDHDRASLHTPLDDINKIESETGYISMDKASEILYQKISIVRRLATRGILEKNDAEEISVDSLKTYAQKKEKTSGSHVDGRRDKLNFVSDGLEERKQEALGRLNKYGNELTTTAMTDVLGFKNTASANRLTEVIDSRKDGYRIHFQKDSVIRYIQEHNPTGKGWVQDKQKSNQYSASQDQNL